MMNTADYAAPALEGQMGLDNEDNEANFHC